MSKGVGVSHLLTGAEQHRAQRLCAAGHGVGGTHPAPRRRVRHAQRPAPGCAARPRTAALAEQQVAAHGLAEDYRYLCQRQSAGERQFMRLLLSNACCFGTDVTSPLAQNASTIRHLVCSPLVRDADGGAQHPRSFPATSCLLLRPAGATHWQLFPDWYAALLGEPLEVLC